MKVVVAGAGQAAIAFAAKLRELESEAAITLIGDEPTLPYQRPPLSKKYMTGEMAAERLLLRPADWYEENNVTCLTGERVKAIDRDNKQVIHSTGSTAYDKLLIATGATPRTLQATIGGDLTGVFTLRNLADADRIANEMAKGKRALIVGGGYIGLEAAAVFAAKGMQVTVVEMAERILQRVAAGQTADFIRDKHVAHGVTILESTAIESLEGKNGRVTHAMLPGGNALPIDTVLVGIGVVPATDLAETCGLECDNGVAVDPLTRTSDPDIHAAGDVAGFAFRGQRRRLESVQNAIDQAEAAARIIAGGDTPYNPMPWFWSDQYDMKLQIAGLNAGYDQAIVRPGSHEGGQSVWYFAGQNFLAVDAINDGRAYMLGKKVLETGRTITPEQAGDADFDLKGLIKP